MLPIEGYLTTQDGVRLYFQKHGSGPNAVIVPNAVHMFESFKHLAANRTIIFFDLRNRGRSESVSDASKLVRGIHNDVDDVETVRQHFQIDQVDLVGHSYVGLLVIFVRAKIPRPRPSHRANRPRSAECCDAIPSASYRSRRHARRLPQQARAVTKCASACRSG